MMKKILVNGILFGIAGLIIGYALFGKMAGHYLNIKSIFSTTENDMISLGKELSGIKGIQVNILIIGGIGLLVGIIFTVYKRK